MKKLIRTVLALVLTLALITSALLFAGVSNPQLLMDLLPGSALSLLSSWGYSAHTALSRGAQLYSQLSDHRPPSGDGAPLEGDLPEDLLPQAESLYSFAEELYPYRAMLSEVEQAAYDQVYANAMALHDTLPLHTPIPSDSLVRAMRAVFYDHPELFWVDTDYRYSFLSQDSVVAVALSFNETAADIETHRARFESAARQVIQGARELGTAVEQEKYVHDYLLDNVSYQLDAPLNQSAYSALVYGESVCAGYSRAFQYILLELGIPCYYCSGEAGEPHAWNMVRLEDGYYHVDVTWDDPLGNDTGRRFYNYFNLTDREIEEDHTRTDLTVYLPACSATGYSYANEFGEEALLRSLEEAGFRQEDILSSMDAYYQYCIDKLMALGPGTHTFSLVTDSRELLDEIFRLTDTGEALENYAAPAVERMGLNGFSLSVSLQGEVLEGDCYLLTQQVHLEEWAEEDQTGASLPAADRDMDSQEGDVNSDPADMESSAPEPSSPADAPVSFAEGGDAPPQSVDDGYRPYEEDGGELGG